jgi:hypothetical protein
VFGVGVVNGMTKNTNKLKLTPLGGRPIQGGARGRGADLTAQGMRNAHASPRCKCATKFKLSRLAKQELILVFCSASGPRAD